MNLKGRTYEMGNANDACGTRYLVMELGSRDVISIHEKRSDASSAMIAASLNKDIAHILLAEIDGKENLVVVEKF